MSQPTRQFAFSILLGVVSSFAAAQTPYKCGNSYSETPCVDGKPVVNQDLRTDEQKRQADETTIRQKKAAGRFERDRIAQEKRDAKALREADSAVIIGEKTEPAAGNPGKPGKPKLIKPPKPAKPAKPAKTVKAAKQKKPAKPAARP
jgi:hypothetical protein